VPACVIFASPFTLNQVILGSCVFLFLAIALISLCVFQVGLGYSTCTSVHCSTFSSKSSAVGGLVLCCQRLFGATSTFSE
jgi:hypothetical protein